MILRMDSNRPRVVAGLGDFVWFDGFVDTLGFCPKAQNIVNTEK